MAKKIVETPLMKQYLEMKKKHPDAVLLFRVGDFYETFSEDAITTSEILGITLTRRANGAAQHVELAGFPHHALDSYLPRLVRAGKRVAICEQLEDPKLAKKLVKRGITELVTPGVAMSDNILDHRSNNFLAALHFDRREPLALIGLALLDISTGEFLTAQAGKDRISKLLSSFAPKEVLVERGKKQLLEQEIGTGYLAFELEDWIFTPSAATDRLLRQFGTQSLKGFGVQGMDCAVIASGAILHYLDITQHTHTSHITSLRTIEEEAYVRLDPFTVRNLELVQPLCPDGQSLLQTIDRTVSPMGARLLRRWLLFPLTDPERINARLDIVEHLTRHPDEADEMRTCIEQTGDLERLTSKASALRITPRELSQLHCALDALQPLRQLALRAPVKPLRRMAESLDPLPELSRRISDTLVDDAPAAIGRGSVVREGVDAELDELRDILANSKRYLLEMQQEEIRLTGIPSLKVGFNNVFGYYIEVTNTHKDKVPERWIRKQTLVNAERYITEELKQYEEKILGAQDRIQAIEQRIFADLLTETGRHIAAIQQNAHLVGRMDILAAFARVATENHYVRPVIDTGLGLTLTAARHPVIEQRLPPGQPYVANSVSLHNDETQILMITGPNMSGKSALLRQTALNVILAQTGSFVAADEARIGVVDKIFTRVGASDNISLGESTFMVEMTEAATILNNITARSLILFDELGRGTSTYDGISIAWAIVEHLHTTSTVHPKTLFATHYHELNDMATTCERISNVNVSVKEIDGKVVFMRTLVPGGSEHSFGIHVAKLAGMPPSVIARARQILETLEMHSAAPAPDVKALTQQAPVEEGVQLSFFQLDDPVLEAVRDQIIGIDIDSLSPLQALNKLAEIRTILTGK